MKNVKVFLNTPTGTMEVNVVANTVKEGIQAAINETNQPLKSVFKVVSKNKVNQYNNLF